MTGFGGTTRKADETTAGSVRPLEGGKVVRVDFTANVHSAMPWKFRPTQRDVRVVRMLMSGGTTESGTVCPACAQSVPRTYTPPNPLPSAGAWGDCFGLLYWYVCDAGSGLPGITLSKQADAWCLVSGV